MRLLYYSNPALVLTISQHAARAVAGQALGLNLQALSGSVRRRQVESILTLNIIIRPGIVNSAQGYSEVALSSDTGRKR